jgi:hypothetical protein
LAVGPEQQEKIDIDAATHKPVESGSRGFAARNMGIARQVELPTRPAYEYTDAKGVLRTPVWLRIVYAAPIARRQENAPMSAGIAVHLDLHESPLSWLAKLGLWHLCSLLDQEYILPCGPNSEGTRPAALGAAHIRNALEPWMSRHIWQRPHGHSRLNGAYGSVEQQAQNILLRRKTYYVEAVTNTLLRSAVVTPRDGCSILGA